MSWNSIKQTVALLNFHNRRILKKNTFKHTQHLDYVNSLIKSSSTLFFIFWVKNKMLTGLWVTGLAVVEKILVGVPENSHAFWYLKWVNATVYCCTRCWFISTILLAFGFAFLTNLVYEKQAYSKQGPRRLVVLRALIISRFWPFVFTHVERISNVIHFNKVTALQLNNGVFYLFSFSMFKLTTPQDKC